MKIKRCLIFCISVTVNFAICAAMIEACKNSVKKSKMLSLDRLPVIFLKFQNSAASRLHNTVHLKLQIVILSHTLHKTLENKKVFLVKSNP